MKAMLISIVQKSSMQPSAISDLILGLTLTISCYMTGLEIYEQSLSLIAYCNLSSGLQAMNLLHFDVICLTESHTTHLASGFMV